MPAAVAIPLITAAATAGGVVASAKLQSNAANRARKSTDRATTEAMAYERERDALERRQYDQEYARKTALEDADRRMAEEDRRRQMMMQDRALALDDARQQRINQFRNGSLAALLAPQAGPLAPIPLNRTAGKTLASLL